jgi:hypothetical protein
MNFVSFSVFERKVSHLRTLRVARMEPFNTFKLSKVLVTLYSSKLSYS